MIARQPSGAPAGPAARAPASGGSGAGAGDDTDAIYDEILRRLRQEQEQLGQLIRHPF